MSQQDSGNAASLRAITTRNRDSWNQIAPRRHGEPASLFRDGGLTLEDYERELAGDVTGKRVLHLACSNGDGVLSWASLGAIAAGADISEVAISKAVRKAAEAGIRAEFHCADMFDLPPRLSRLDLIYLSWGAMCWVPDLDVFARVVAGRLRQHGSVLICDHHPVWEVLAVRAENRLAVTRDYFGRHRPGNPDDAKQPSGARGEAGAPAFDAFVWPVSDVVMSLVRAGLRLDAFFEAPSPEADGWPGLGDVAWPRIPAIYVIKATKTDPGPGAIS
ncbi:MAG: class I SAM-dependent methyltransferase [Trebonia sp.]